MGYVERDNVDNGEVVYIRQKGPLLICDIWYMHLLHIVMSSKNILWCGVSDNMYCCINKSSL